MKEGRRYKKRLVTKGFLEGDEKMEANDAPTQSGGRLSGFSYYKEKWK